MSQLEQQDSPTIPDSAGGPNVSEMTAALPSATDSSSVERRFAVIEAAPNRCAIAQNIFT
ncbi:hypothetical protein [Microcoleus sp. bin38.metabat.b11b12b14.051]|uniref:hypothetical protein n=1 Tax=Microcoleus sp. bin38.metabat.b11b12b14.051 TaxID=2742709 RepID=UPI0025F31BBC|nr:hypothetical protein [Microcoleus sp. bin38.metabat.b11b12b14.051]